jgi:AAA family ATP:ADP antiporter
MSVEWLVWSNPVAVWWGFLLVVSVANIVGLSVTEAVCTVASGATGGLSAGQFIGGYVAVIDFWQNVLVVLIQFFLVSRIFKYLGVGKALFILPLISFTSYGLFTAAPVLALIRIAKIAENATDYSLQNTLRRALFLPTSREAKYKAKAAIDGFFKRFGDVLQAGIVYLGSSLGFAVSAFAALNIGFTIVWIVIAAALSREYRKRSHRTSLELAMVS